MSSIFCLYDFFVVSLSSKTKNMTSFIQATARDYDMPIIEVETLYNRYVEEGDYSKFYEKLEEDIKERSAQ